MKTTMSRIAVVFALALAAPALAVEDESKVPTLMVTGQGDVEARPDQAVLSLGATAQAQEASAAQEQVNQTMRRALESIRALGVAQEKIQTATLSLSPVYSRPEPMPRGDGAPREPRIVGYRASNTVQVTLEDLSLIGRVVDAGVTAGANEVHGLSFQLRDDAEHRQQALRQAVRKARAKAQVLAEAAGVRLESVYEVREGGVGVIPHPMMDFGRAAMMEAATPIQPGQVRVQADVTIRYRIAPGAEPSRAEPATEPRP